MAVTAQASIAASKSMVRCNRCNAHIQPYTNGPADDGTDMWVDSEGHLACMDYHGHDEHGIYVPLHNPNEDWDRTVVHDSADGCVELMYRGEPDE
jgi:hypothetical protein